MKQACGIVILTGLTLLAVYFARVDHPVHQIAPPVEELAVPVAVRHSHEPSFDSYLDAFRVPVEPVDPDEALAEIFAALTGSRLQREMRAAMQEPWEAAKPTLDLGDLRWLGERAVGPLLKWVEGGGYLYPFEIAGVLSHIGMAAADELLLALKNDNPAVRDVAACALGRIGDSRAIKPLIGLLSDDGPCVRGDAVEALGRLKAASAVEPIAELLNDENESVRIRASVALAKLGDDRAIPALRPLLLMSREDEIEKRSNRDPSEDRICSSLSDRRQRPLSALAGFGTPSAVDALVDVVRENADAYHPNDFEFLGKPGSEAVPRLARALRNQLPNGNAQKRRSTDGDRNSPSAILAKMLGAAEDVRAVPVLIEALKDGDMRTRLAAAEALGTIRDPVAVDDLLAALGDEDDWVHDAARSAIIQIGDPRATPALMNPPPRMKTTRYNGGERAALTPQTPFALDPRGDPNYVASVFEEIEARKEGTRGFSTGAERVEADDEWDEVESNLEQMRTGDEETRARSREKLRDSDDPRAVDYFSAAVAEYTPGEWLIDALAGDPLPAIRALASDDSVRVRNAVDRTLARIRGGKCEGPIIFW